MKDRFLLTFSLLCSLVLVVFLFPSALGRAAESAVGGATVTVDAGKPAAYKIPRTIFGTFLEPIGNAVYGGLWAEVLQNPSFEENLWAAGAIRKMITDEPSLERSSRLGLPLPWEPLDYAQGARYEARWGDAANSSRSLFLMALPDKPSGLRQKVYLPVHRTLRYVGYVYAKHASGPLEIEVSIRSRNKLEPLLCRSVIQLSEGDWKRYDFTLELPAERIAPLEPADFVIAASHETRVLLDQASLMPADNVDGMDPDIIALARAMKTPVVRFGGNFTSAYHWRDGVGPRDKRVSMLNVAWGIPEYNLFGTDEFLRFCELVGAQPQICLNLGSGTPEEAAAWVDYVNQHWSNRSGGLLWELGNELWGDFQVGYPTLPRVADRTKAFSDAVRRADPRARLITTGGDPDWYPDWNAAQLASAPGAFEYLSTHFVVGSERMVKANPSPDFIAHAMFALPVELERRLREMRKQIVSKLGANGPVKIAFTEWLFWGPDDSFPRCDNLGGAIATGGFLNMLMRVADFVPISDMTGIVEFGGIWKKRSRVFGVPAYWVFNMYSNADAAQPVETRVDVEDYTVEQGSARLPDIANVPYLDVIAALNDSGDKLTLFCVNRHLSRDITARIDIKGFEHEADVTATALYSQSIYDKNDEVNPEAIRPRPSTFTTGSGLFDYTFRPTSVTVIRFERKD